MTSHSSIHFGHVTGQQHRDDSAFPLMYVNDDTDLSMTDVLSWTTQHRDALLRQATDHGAVAFRGFPTCDVDAFDRVIASLAIENFPYKKSLSNAVRINRTPRVFSANEAPPEVRIFFHHEMAQTPIYPRYILFYCEIAAEQGGATPLCRSDWLYESLAAKEPKFIQECERFGLRYTNVMPGCDDPHSGMGRSWQSTLGVTDRRGAEKRLNELGYSFEWMDADCLKATTPALPAVMEVEGGRRVFFNQLIAAYCGWKDDRNDPSDAIRLGDGRRLDADAVTVAVDLAEELSYDHHWRAGDFVLLDNTVAMHARRPFVGTRKVVASLAEMRGNAFLPLESLV